MLSWSCRRVDPLNTGVVAGRPAKADAMLPKLPPELVHSTPSSGNHELCVKSMGLLLPDSMANKPPLVLPR
jgi:hypothetical protein